MKWFLHSSSLRYALALWLATVMALFIAFVLQLEPAQWSAITVWIIFMQTPRLNYSKIIWWSFGTIVGAFMAVVLIVCFNQTPEIFLISLALWLSLCAAAATLVTSYRAYGGVLAGYTCAIVSMSASDHPDLIFRLAVTRVCCIFIGIFSAIVAIAVLLPRNRHWRDTLHHLGGHLKASLLQASKALGPDLSQPAHFSWRHMVDRLSTLEHTLAVTTAESADSRTNAPQARSLVATLFDLLAKAQAVEIHLSRPETPAPAPGVNALLSRARKLLTDAAATISVEQATPQATALSGGIERLRIDVVIQRRIISTLAGLETVSSRFVLDRLDEILESLSYALHDWSGLFGPWMKRRPTHLAVHQDYRTAFIYGLRMFLAMTLASVLWFVTDWPSGSQLILFTAVVCSLLSLLDHAPLLGFEFLKSALFCAVMAYIEAFWLFQIGEGFLVLALALGLFLVPAAYAYRHPRLIGGAVVSMLIFYGLTMPANQMNYDIVAFLNNGLALLGATVCGFFSFHAVPSLTDKARQFWLLRATRHELAGGPGSEQGWTSRMFDRIRLLHRTAEKPGEMENLLDAENEMLLSLQVGLRHRQLRAHLKENSMAPNDAMVVAEVLREYREIHRHPAVVALLLRSACVSFEEGRANGGRVPESRSGALAEMWEMTHLLERSTRLYID